MIAFAHEAKQFIFQSIPQRGIYFARRGKLNLFLEDLIAKK